MDLYRLCMRLVTDIGYIAAGGFLYFLAQKTVLRKEYKEFIIL